MCDQLNLIREEKKRVMIQDAAGNEEIKTYDGKV